MMKPVAPGLKTHRSHVSGKRRGARFAARLKDKLVAQAKRLETQATKAWRMQAKSVMEDY